MTRPEGAVHTVITLKQLLEEMIQREASDLHITAGEPPEFRIDGDITPSEYEILTPKDTLQLAYSVLTDEQQKKLRERRASSTSPSASRTCRASAATCFMQRGCVSMVIRQIPFEIMTFESLGPAGVGARVRRTGRRAWCSSPARPARASRRRWRR